MPWRLPIGKVFEQFEVIRLLQPLVVIRISDREPVRSPGLRVQPVDRLHVRGAPGLATGSDL